MPLSLAIPQASLPSLSAVALLALRVVDLLGPSPPLAAPIVCQAEAPPAAGWEPPLRGALAVCEARLSELAVCKEGENKFEETEAADIPVWSVLAALWIEKILICLVWRCCRRNGGQQRDREATGVGQVRNSAHASARARMLGNGVLE